MKKRLLALGLCAAFMLCACDNKPESAPETGISAPPGGDRVNPVEESKPDWEYRETYSGDIEVTAYNGSDTTVKIPTELDGKPVTEMGYAFRVRSPYVTTIEIPACIEDIDPKMICEGVTEFIVEDSNERYFAKDGILYKKLYNDKIVFFSCPHGRKGEITVPGDVSEIGNYAFCDCTKITSVTLPEGITKIGIGAFSDCTELTEVNIPKSVEDICTAAFDGCKRLENLSIPETVTYFGSHPFDGTPFLANLQAKDPLVIINNILVDGTAAGEANVPDGVTEICSAAFKPDDGSNTVTTKIILPDSVEEIGTNAFAYCEALTEVRLPAGLKKMENWFSRCGGLTEFTVPDGVEKIGSFFFTYCDNLTKVTLPDSIVEIDDFDFLNGSEKAVVVYKGKTYAQTDFETLFADVEKNALSSRPEWEYREQDDGSLSISAYNGTAENVKIPAEIDGKPVTALSLTKLSPTQGVKTIEIPASVAIIWSRNFGETITEITVAEDNPYYRSKDGMLFEREDNALFAVPLGISGAVNVPDGTNGIGAYAFSECANVTSVTLPEGVTYIDMSAFSLCGALESVNIPSTVTEIGDHAFYGCEKLETLQIPANVTSFGEVCFYGTPFLEMLREKDALVVINGVLVDGKNAVGAVVIPDNVTKIASSAFAQGYSGNNEITSVTVPDSVVEIGDEAFSMCDNLVEARLPSGLKELPEKAFYRCSSLKKIEIPSTVEEIGWDVFSGCKSLESVTVPDSVKKASYSCFDYCPKIKLTYKGKTYTAANIKDFYTDVE